MIPAIVLAAGLSSRMGRPKALLPLGPGVTFLSRLVSTFRRAGAADVIVVTGHEARAVETDAERLDVDARLVMNPSYELGQLSSLLAGLAVADRPGVRAVLVSLVDVPMVGADTVTAVLERYRATGASIVRPVDVRAPGRHGHPVLFDRDLFQALRAADPRGGAKPVVHAHLTPESEVEVTDEGAFRDIDTPEDYARLLAELREGGPTGPE